MTYDPDITTISEGEPLENNGQLLTPLMVFAAEVLLYEKEAEPLDLRDQAEHGNEEIAVDNLVKKVADCCRESKVGKKLPTAFYIHVSALATLNPVLTIYEKCARQNIENIEEATLVKFQLHQPKISYLFYPDFDTDAHPALQRSIQINLETGEVKCFDYSHSENPPVLHRKETFVTADYPQYQKFSKLTRSEEKWGLLDNTSVIGTREGWLKYLGYCGVEIQDHTVVEICQQGNSELSMPKIERHKAAMLRNSLSKPVRLVLEADLFVDGMTFFDYGCGYGGDIQHIAQEGYAAAGWDPYYQPDSPQINADIVNIGYVINVIESLGERREALLNAWGLTKKLLVVAAQVLIDDSERGQIAYGDGVITSRNTFQKYYEQEELKIYIDQVLSVDAIPVALGIYFVFRDAAEGQSFRASRFRSHLLTPRVRSQVKRFEDYAEMLAPLMAFVSDRGRLPVKGELAEEVAIKGEFHSFNRAWRVILQATDADDWETIADKRRQDLLVYLALNGLEENRPSMRQLPAQIRNDIKGLFDNYQKACTLADLMLYSLGKTEIIGDCCEDSAIGYKLPGSLSVHVSALEELDPLLRLYEGCANRTIGRLDGATIIKFYANQPKISYLFYPDFDTNPHPVLQTSMHINLRDFSVGYQDYSHLSNPPILVRKEAFVAVSYPHYQKFAKLSRQEEKLGILDKWGGFKYREWVKCLEENCVRIKGHRLFWRSDADPEKLKILQTTASERQQKKIEVNGGKIEGTAEGTESTEDGKEEGGE
ncbi:MAG: DNA phosphorothioation-associated putative methyltransferase [Tychonema bourrellyi B0820]|uniref:DNA phosphorothioation-associated methyltransferase n=1 Tax=Tychonema bourrellyi FEM_GT703 TaxID=2040638 RepID=A0A2G4F389_9CYAN|nr:DNA phosphorothioation-associated putative methyltransferase [Tychonema bourrellyi]MDQ2100883.1 DNA phosphorothioation-associated putative methyltransferase [Tychonema bourrellyi B0820]PHX56230.1 DNA phosphorothioation-associated methyltransferase [Tychonema bourrellyi FEM_GT703]